MSPVPDPIEVAKEGIKADIDQCIVEINEAFDKFLDKLKGRDNCDKRHN